ncbi:site-specific recombinase, phage integrase family domain protein [Burkholderia pseudomallei MSHR7334]|nr:site-specific recombinase, phage integrase family domain protein [Burkholderia pseudomallei MSHR7334]
MGSSYTGCARVKLRPVVVWSTFWCHPKRSVLWKSCNVTPSRYMRVWPTRLDGFKFNCDKEPTTTAFWKTAWPLRRPLSVSITSVKLAGTYSWLSIRVAQTTSERAPVSML